MRTLGRIVIILVAALIVIGTTYAISQTAAAQALTGQSMEMGAAGDPLALSSVTNGQNNPTGEMNGRPAGGRDGGAGLIETLGRNLLKLGAIIVVVQVLWSIGQRLKLSITALVRKERLTPSHTS